VSRARFQALLIGLALFGAAAIGFAIKWGTEQEKPAAHLPPAKVRALTNIAAREAAQSQSNPRRATLIATTDSALARLNHDHGHWSGTRLYLVVIPGTPPYELLYREGPAPRTNIPRGGSTVFEFRASDLSQMDFSFGVSGRALEKLGPHVEIQLR
jgi:hypothetical protein